MRLPRYLHKLYAMWFGYFWLPCPLCKRMFGGHETTGALNGTLWTGYESGKAVCPQCVGKPETEHPFLKIVD